MTKQIHPSVDLSNAT